MAIVSAFPGGAMDAADYCRTNYILAGGRDRITSGLRMAAYSDRTVQISAGTGICGGIPFTNIQTEFFQSDLEPSSNPRFDRLVARKTIVPGTPTVAPYAEVQLAILKGPPSPDPQLPALTQDHGGVWEFGLGYWLIGPNNLKAIPNGLVWGHYANIVKGEHSTAVVGGGNDDGSTHLIYANSDLRVPGAGKVKLKVLVSITAEQLGFYSLTLQMLGQSEVVTFQVEWGEENLYYPHMLTIPAELEADVPAGGGTVSFIVQMNAGAKSGPLDVRHIYAKLVEVMS